MENTQDILSNTIGNGNLYNILLSLAIVLSLWVVHSILVRLVMRRADDARTRYLWAKGLTYGAVFLGLILVFQIWFSRDLTSFQTFLGLLVAGLAIAMKDIITNVVGWVFLIWVSPFDIGDRIQIGDLAGDVVDKSIFHITIMEIGNWVDADQSTGRVIKIPNSYVFTQPLANYSKGFEYIWNEIPVLVTFESDWKKAKEILLEIARKHSEDLSSSAEEKIREASSRFLIYYTKLTPIVYTSVRDSGVLLTVRYLCEPRRRRGIEERIWEDILGAFAEQGNIDFAYPTTRFYDDGREGKSGPQRPPENGQTR